MVLNNISFIKSRRGAQPLLRLMKGGSAPLLQHWLNHTFPRHQQTFCPANQCVTRWFGCIFYSGKTSSYICIQIFYRCWATLWSHREGVARNCICMKTLQPIHLWGTSHSKKRPKAVGSHLVTYFIYLPYFSCHVTFQDSHIYHFPKKTHRLFFCIFTEKFYIKCDFQEKQNWES